MTTATEARPRFDSTIFRDAPQGRWYIHRDGFNSGHGILSAHDDESYHVMFADRVWRNAHSPYVGHDELVNGGWILVADTTGLEPQPGVEVPRPAPGLTRLSLEAYASGRLSKPHQRIEIDVELTESEIETFRSGGHPYGIDFGARMRAGIRKVWPENSSDIANTGWEMKSVQIVTPTAQVTTADESAKEEPMDLGTYVGDRIADIHNRQSAEQIRLLETQLASARAELVDFKNKVVTLGEEYATNHNFCSVYDELMDELGLERPSRRVKITGTVEVTIYADFNGSDRSDATSRSFIQSSFRSYDLEDAVDLLDSDWDDQSVSAGSFTVHSVERV
jgi:hypothetical protein